MFRQHRFIPDEHKSALQAVVQSHRHITSAKLVQLYEAALNTLTKPETMSSTDFAYSTLVTAGHTIAVVTDRKQGFYLQLARENGKSKHYLTVGQKLAMEQPDPLHSTVSTIYW